MRKLLVGVATAIAVVGLGSGTAMAVPAGLEQDKKAEAWTCEGEDVTIFVAGRSGWIGDTHYLASSFTFEGTFTPSDGSEPQTVTQSKNWGPADIGRDAITCTMHIEETEEETEEDGTFVGDATIIAFPVR